MAISSFIRGAGKAVSSLGRAVQAATSKFEGARPTSGTVVSQPGVGTEAPAQPLVGPPSPSDQVDIPAPKGFMLPDLGPGPDDAAPEYQGDAGQKKYQSDLAEYQHKQDIHKAYQDLDKIYTETHPQRNFQQEYQDLLAEQKQHEKERPQGSNLARAALALGDFNPAMRQSGRSGLDEYNARVAGEQESSDKSFSARMALKQKMYEQNAADATAQGNWKRALAESEKAALLSADTEAMKHRYEMEKTEAVQTATTERARIRREAMENSAQIRARAISGAHGLSGSFEAQFEKEAAKAVAKMLGPKDLTKDYDPADLEKMTDYLEHLGEMFHDQQYGQGSHETYMNTAPGKRPKPKAETKEKF